VTEIRSYRRVFDLERRIYRIDRLRLNPSGVPVLGIVYFMALLGASLVLARVPVLSLAAGQIPWYLRAVVLPGLTAAVLSVIRIEGRPFHLAATALLRFGLGPRWLARLQPCRAAESRWYPEELIVLPDGSDGRLRRLLYRGPGAALVAVAYARGHPAPAAGSLGGALRLHSRLTVRELPGAPRPGRAQVIELAPGASLLCQPHDAA
jgi:hypothetical protein